MRCPGGCSLGQLLPGSGAILMSGLKGLLIEVLCTAR